MKQVFRSKVFRIAMLSCLVLSMMVCTAFASEGGGTASSSAAIISAFTTGFQQIVADATGVVVAAVPIALGLAGTIFLARKAISWFKSMAK